MIREIAEKSYTISYRKLRSDGSATIKFATVAVLYGHPTLILHIGKKQDEYGMTFQQKIDELIGLTYLRNKDQLTEKTHEVFIRIDLIVDLEAIFPYIDYAYEHRA